MKLTESQLYGPIGRAGWDAIESEIDRICAERGMSVLEKYAAGFTLDLQTGELRLIETTHPKVRAEDK